MLVLSDGLIRMPTMLVAEARAGAGGGTWLYDFAWRSPSLGAAHGVELALHRVRRPQIIPRFSVDVGRAAGGG